MVALLTSPSYRSSTIEKLRPAMRRFGRQAATNPVPRLKRFFALQETMLRAGGVAIPPPDPASSAHPPIWTLVQPDADVVTIVVQSSIDDRPLLQAHAEEVGRWYADSAKTIADATFALRQLAVAPATLVSVTWLAISRGSTYLAVRLGVVLGCYLLPIAIGAVVRWRIRDALHMT